MMQNYEIVLITYPDSKDNISKIIEYYKNLIKTKNGKIHRLENWGKRQLAYPIKKNYQANYLLLNIEIASNKINSIKEDINFNESIIRNLILKVKHPIKEESIIMKNKDNYQEIIYDSKNEKK